LKKQNLVAAVVVVILVAVAAVVYLRLAGPPGAPARVVAADDRDYFNVVHELLSGAQRSIDVIIYQGRFYFQYPLSKSNALIADLVDAGERGVKVRAILEQANWNHGNSEDNRDVWSVLAGTGVSTYFDPLETTSHSKLVVVDGKYTVMGSMNWSYYALDKNNEAAVVVESPEIAGEFEAYFDKVLAASTPTYALPEKYVGAADAVGSKSRTVFVRDLVDSARFAQDQPPETRRGLLYMAGVRVVVDEDALEEALALDSLFFAEAAGETVRVFGEIPKGATGEIHALDLETPVTQAAVTRAFGLERSRLKGLTYAKPVLAWVDAGRVIAIPNDKYIPEVTRLVASAKKRVWVAMLDARYYETRPVPPERDKRRPKDAPPSLTNVLLDRLQEAARRGVDVQVICDVGPDGQASAPNNKLAFLKRLTDAGGKAYWDSPDVTTHAKLAIVDDDFTVVGSTNWSQPAVEDNNETAVVIESAEINRHYAGFIERVRGQAFDARAIGAAPRP